MTSIVYPFRRFPMIRLTQRWMAEKPRASDVGKLVAYYNCPSDRPHPGYLRFPKRVLEVSLEEGAAALHARCDASVRYKIRRAQRDGIISSTEENQEAFFTFYNVFAGTKDLSELDHRLLTLGWPHLTVTKAEHQGVPLAMHAYLVDTVASRASLLYSCSHFRRETDSRKRNFLGNASRFLYWDDMRRFSLQGIRHLDFGPYRSTGEFNQVNAFKMGYPCLEKPVSTYISLPLYVFRRLTQPGHSF